MRIRKLPAFAAAACLVLVLTGVWKVEHTPRLLQYVIEAPADANELTELGKSRETALDDMKEAVEASCVVAYTSSATIEAGEINYQTAMYAGTGDMFSVYPEYLKEGRLPSATELKEGADVIALNESLAFALFPTTGALDAKVKLGEKEYTVVGVTYDDIRIVDASRYAAFLPLDSIADAVFETLTLSVLPVPDSGADILFKNTAPVTWCGGGDTYVLDKEVMRTILPIRIPFTVVCAALFIALGRRIVKLYTERTGEIAERLRYSYLAKLLPRISVYIAAAAVITGIFGYAVYRFADWVLIPLRVFPEWVPDDPTRWSSILNVIRSMASAGSSMVKVRTGEMCVLDYWHTIISYSTVAMLVLALFSINRKQQTD